MIVITKKQRDLVRHALGFNGRQTISYRNHFVTGPGSDDFEPWMDLVKKGYAHHRPGSEISGGDDIFWAKLELALFVRQPTEHLGQDFRE